MPLVIALMDDLLFLTRIREAARSSGVEIRSVRRTSQLLEAVREGASLVLVDADSERLPWAEAVSALRADAGLAGTPICAFLSHVHAERAERARSAGCSRVLARGAFVQELPRLLGDAAARGEVTEEPTP
jgi:CheY-like chemotaxis protein